MSELVTIVFIIISFFLGTLWGEYQDHRQWQNKIVKTSSCPGGLITWDSSTEFLITCPNGTTDRVIITRK